MEYTARPLVPPDEASVRRELDRVLKSAAFQGSRRCQEFLSYVVTSALSGNGDNIKERTLAVDVFQRDANSDLDNDSIVRVGAREVRKRLMQFYATEGRQSEVQIDLPTGSYVPFFRMTAAPDTVKDAVEAAPRETRTWRSYWAIILGAIGVAALALTIWRFGMTHSAFDTFWNPAFRQNGPVLLVQAHPLVYQPSTRASQLNDEKNPQPPSPAQRALNLPPEVLNGADFVPVFDQFVGLGDANAVTRLTELFDHHSIKARERLASRLDFVDLRDTPAVLIGGSYTNRWTKELSRTLRYRFEYCGVKPCIVDFTTKKEWLLTEKADNGRSPYDYILISRLPRSETGGFIVIGGGLTQYGTNEVGRILSDPGELNPVLGKLPAGWQEKNVQFVLHSQVVGETPATPELIAWNVW